MAAAEAPVFVWLRTQANQPRAMPSPASPLAIVGGLALAALLTGTFALWQRTGALERRLETVETRLSDLEPIRQVVAASRPRPDGQAAAYAAAQATGPADVNPTGVDDTRAWCAARQDEPGAWLELGYGEPVEAKAVRIHASHNPGGIIRITGSDGAEATEALWEGRTGADAIAEVPLASPKTLRVVRLHFDLEREPAWREIDAVALIDTTGALHWAKTARASSEWRPGAER